MRARQIERRDEDVKETVCRLERMRKQNKKYFDENNSVREENELRKNDMIIVFNIRNSQDKFTATKLNFR